MTERFDPYHRWLGIPPGDQPPNHYRLLGVNLFESDADVIDCAVNRQMAHLRTFQGGPHAALSQRLLNEVATARLCLLNPAKKAAYDDCLRHASRISEAARLPPSTVAPPPLPSRAATVVQTAVSGAETEGEYVFDIAALVQQASRAPGRSGQRAEADKPDTDGRKKPRLGPNAISAIVAGSLILGAMIVLLIVLILTKPPQPPVVVKPGPAQPPSEQKEPAPSPQLVPALATSAASEAEHPLAGQPPPEPRDVRPADTAAAKPVPDNEPSADAKPATEGPPAPKPKNDETAVVKADPDRPEAVQDPARSPEEQAAEAQHLVLRATYIADKAEKAATLAKARKMFEEVRPRFLQAEKASVDLLASLPKKAPRGKRENAAIVVGENRLSVAMVDFYLAQTQGDGPERTAALEKSIKQFDAIYQDFREAALEREAFVGWRGHFWHARIRQELGKLDDAKLIFEEVAACDPGNIEDSEGKPAGRTRTAKPTGLEPFFADVEQSYLQVLFQLPKNSYRAYLEEAKSWRAAHKANSESCPGYQALTLELAENYLEIGERSTKKETKDAAKTVALKLLGEMAAIQSPCQQDAVKLHSALEKADYAASNRPVDEPRSEDRIPVAASHLYDGNGAMAFGPGPKLVGGAGSGAGLGGGKDFGSRSAKTGFGGRDSARRKAMIATYGGSKQTERAVAAALVWLANHQDYVNGNWSLQSYVLRCKDRTCSGQGSISADAGATALGLLPFLAAGQTHKSRGPYKDHIRKGLEWLIRHQQPDGNLAKGAQQMMYSHGLATMALAEAYGLTGDLIVGRAAQGGVNFILAAQNKADGGWRYNPGDAGDTSVVGWELMALKSAHLAGLTVGPAGSAFSGASKWLDSVAVNDGTEYSYQPRGGPSSTMTAVGLLCRQYLGAKRDDPMLIGGMAYLLNHLPDDSAPNIYYWYYATQAMHNMSGYEWDTWNRKMRDLLVRTQVRSVDVCANGSWSPEKDAWGNNGGRLMTTSLSCLTLEIYYRYPPLFAAKGGGKD